MHLSPVCFWSASNIVFLSFLFSSPSLTIRFLDTGAAGVAGLGQGDGGGGRGQVRDHPGHGRHRHGGAQDQRCVAASD